MVTHSGTGLQASPYPTPVFRLYANLFSCCQNTSHQIKFSLSGQQRLSRRQCGGIGLSPILPMSLLVSVTKTWIGHRCKGYGTCQITDSSEVAECISCWKMPQSNFNMLWKYLPWPLRGAEERPKASALRSNATYSLILPSSLHIGLKELLTFMQGL